MGKIYYESERQEALKKGACVLKKRGTYNLDDWGSFMGFGKWKSVEFHNQQSQY